MRRILVVTVILGRAYFTKIFPILAQKNEVALIPDLALSSLPAQKCAYSIEMFCLCKTLACIYDYASSLLSFKEHSNDSCARLILNLRICAEQL